MTGRVVAADGFVFFHNHLVVLRKRHQTWVFELSLCSLMETHFLHAEIQILVLSVVVMHGHVCAQSLVVDWNLIHLAHLWLRLLNC